MNAAADVGEASRRREERARFFRDRAAGFRRAWAQADRRALLYANVRLVLFLSAFALMFFVWRGRVPSQLGWGELALAVLFMAVAAAHDRVIRRAERLKLFGVINDRAALRSERDFAQLKAENPARPLSSASADERTAAQDLGIAGPRSLMLLLDDTFTRAGREALLRMLLEPEGGVCGAKARQEAVRELASRTEFREALEAEGRLACPSGPFDAAGLVAWGGAANEHPAGPWRWPARILPPVTLALWGLWDADILPLPLWAPFLVLQFLLASAFRGRSRRLVDDLGKVWGEARLGNFRGVFELVGSAHFQSGLLASASAQMRASGRSPEEEISRLSSLLNFLRLQSQPLLYAPLNCLFLCDVHLVDALEAWQARCGGLLQAWFGALAEVEALSSLAGYAAMEGDDAAWPEISELPELAASGLGHPLIPGDRRVVNDAALTASASRPAAAAETGRESEVETVPSVLLVTGSNMAGKTTFLRTLGINACLALAGAPVCAASMRIGAVRVVSSMRVEDSLGEGLSLFHAEVRRMKCVLDAAASGPVLFLLDEILHGTNTAERQRASRAIVRELVRLGALGAVATHDLSLSSLAEETNGAVKNVHFTDSLRDGALFFDYRLRDGVVSTTNAILVMRQAGIDLPGMEP